MSDYYILDKDKNVVPATMFERAFFMEEPKNKIVKQENVDGKFVSTVFLGMNHEWNDNNILVFETMVFSKEGHTYELYLDRYSTWKEAEEGHQRAVEWVKNGCIEEEIIKKLKETCKDEGWLT